MAIAYRQRILDRQLATALRALGAVAIEGAKACGKTETARQFAHSEILFDIDPNARMAAEINPQLLLAGQPPILLDEWQRAPSIWDVVRREVDERRQKGQFILTGSATPNDDVPRHSGAGRVSVLRMRPMSLFESDVSSGEISLGALLVGEQVPSTRIDCSLIQYVDEIIIGGWPGLIGASKDEASEFLNGYLDTILEYDIPSVTGTHRDPIMLRRFLHAYAQNIAQPAQLQTIVKRAQGSDLAEQTSTSLSRWAAEPYLVALRRLMVIDEIPAWAPRLRSRTRLTGTPKRLLVDPSLAAVLLSAAGDRLLEDLETLGFLFEALAARDIRIYAQANRASVFHYREQAGNLEVDIVVEKNDGTWLAIEVKLGGSLIDDAAAGLLRLANMRVAQPPSALVVITSTPYAYRRPDGVWVVPLATLGP